jgi:hypothetical protein
MQQISTTSVAAVYDRRTLQHHLRTTFVAFFAFFAVNSQCSAQIQQAWVSRYNNGIPNGTNRAVKMALDTNGNIYVAGFSQNTNGQLGYATIKYAPNGNQIWVARYDSTNYPAAQPSCLALDHQSNVVITGTAVTVKYDPNGNQLWTLPNSGAGVAVDSSNNICITGVASNYTTMKLTPTGTNLWTQTFTSAGPCGAQTVNIGPSDAIYVCGYEFYSYMPELHGVHATLIKYDSLGTQLWAASTGEGTHGYANVQNAQLDNLGGLYFALNCDINMGGGYSFLTYAYSTAGGFLWESGNPTMNGYSLVYDLALDSSNNVFVTGRAASGQYVGAYCTCKINTPGAYVWTNGYPYIPTLAHQSATTNAATAIAVDQSNNVYVTGYSPGTNSGNDIVTIKYDNNGNQIWLERYNGPGNGDDEGNTIAVDANGNVYVAGYETTAAGGTEFVVIKYAPGPFLKKEANGSFLLQAAGAAGENFDFQASTDLLNWQDLGTTNADSNGLVQFLDTNAPLYPYRFYLTAPQQ